MLGITLNTFIITLSVFVLQGLLESCFYIYLHSSLRMEKELHFVFPSRLFLSLTLPDAFTHSGSRVFVYGNATRACQYFPQCLAAPPAFMALFVDRLEVDHKPSGIIASCHLPFMEGLCML